MTDAILSIWPGIFFRVNELGEHLKKFGAIPVISNEWKKRERQQVEALLCIINLLLVFKVKILFALPIDSI